jgi:hypothetical protein
VIASSHGYGSTQAATHDPSHASQDLVIVGDLAYHPTDTFLIRGPGLLQGAEFLGRPATDYLHEVDLEDGGPVSGQTSFANVGGTVWSDRGLLLGDPQTGERLIFDPLGVRRFFYSVVKSPDQRLNPDGSFYFRPELGFYGKYRLDYVVKVFLQINGVVYSLASLPAPVYINVTMSPAANATGIPAAVEDAGPNHGDGDGDGKRDSQEPNVASLPSRVGGGPGPYVTFASPAGTQLFDVRAIDNPSPADAPTDAQGQPVVFPFGFFHFEVMGLAPGEATTVELFLNSPLPAHPTYYKHGGTPKNHTPHWYQFLYRVQTDADDASQTGAVFLDSTHILLYFAQGDRGNDFGSLNGLIEDPGGPAFFASTPALPTAARLSAASAALPGPPQPSLSSLAFFALQDRSSNGNAFLNAPLSATVGTKPPFAQPVVSGAEAPPVGRAGYPASLSGGGGDEEDVWPWLQELWPWVNDKLRPSWNREPAPPRHPDQSQSEEAEPRSEQGIADGDPVTLGPDPAAAEDAPPTSPNCSWVRSRQATVEALDALFADWAEPGDDC